MNVLLDGAVCAAAPSPAVLGGALLSWGGRAALSCRGADVLCFGGAEICTCIARAPPFVGRVPSSSPTARSALALSAYST